MSGQNDMVVKKNARVLIMRHGMAEDYAKDDASRALVPFGHKQVEQTANWFNHQWPDQTIDLAIVSPYARARQTLSVFQQQVSITATETSDDVLPTGDAQLVADALRVQIETLSSTSATGPIILVVSHMPLVSILLDELSPYSQHALFNTGAMAVMEFDQTLGMANLVEHFQGL